MCCCTCRCYSLFVGFLQILFSFIAIIWTIFVLTKYGSEPAKPYEFERNLTSKHWEGILKNHYLNVSSTAKTPVEDDAYGLLTTFFELLGSILQFVLAILLVTGIMKVSLKWNWLYVLLGTWNETT